MKEEEPNMISNWLEENENPLIDKQVEMEALMLTLHALIQGWQQQQIQYEALAEKHIENEHRFKKFKYKAVATRDCWKQLLKAIK